MGYKKAGDILPAELIEMIQEYADGDTIYIPKKKTRAVWGSVSGAKKKLARRNRNIYEEYLSGISVNELAARYYLTDKSIQRIIREIKREIE